MQKTINSINLKIQDKNSDYYAGSTFFLIAFIELTRINQKNDKPNNKLERYRSFAFDMIEKDKDYFKGTASYGEMVSSYISFSQYLEQMCQRFGQCKECSVLTNDYPLLNVCQLAIKSLAKQTAKEHNFDVFNAYDDEENIFDSYKINEKLEKFDVLSDIKKEADKLSYQSIISLLIKLISRRLDLPNKNNLPLDKLLSLLEEAKTDDFDSQKLNEIISLLTTIFENTKSTVKMDYYYSILILKALEEGQTNVK